MIVYFALMIDLALCLEEKTSNNELILVHYLTIHTND